MTSTLHRRLTRAAWFLGVAALAVSISGASWALYTRAGDGGSVSRTDPAAAAPALDNGLVCVVHGNVDIKHGLRSLYPLQTGRVEEVLVEEDQVVKAGDVLLRLDREQAQHLIQQAKAGLDEAVTQRDKARKLAPLQKLQEAEQEKAIAGIGHKIEEAQQQLNRARELSTAQGSTKQYEVKAGEAGIEVLRVSEEAAKIKLQELRVNDPQLDIDRAEAAIRLAQAKLAEAEKGLRECEMKAPANGTILRVLVGKGEVLGATPKQPAILFYPDEPRIIRAELDQEQAARVRKGLAVRIEEDVRATGTVWTGKVDWVSSYYLQKRGSVPDLLGTLNETRTLECIITLDEVSAKNPPRFGQRVRVRIFDPNAR